MITLNPDWELAGIYTDIASGLRLQHREGYKKLLRDCKRGKIDMIIVKSMPDVQSRIELELPAEPCAQGSCRVLGVLAGADGLNGDGVQVAANLLPGPPSGAAGFAVARVPASLVQPQQLPDFVAPYIIMHDHAAHVAVVRSPAVLLGGVGASGNFDVGTVTPRSRPAVPTGAQGFMGWPFFT